MEILRATFFLVFFVVYAPCLPTTSLLTSLESASTLSCNVDSITGVDDDFCGNTTSPCYSFNQCLLRCNNTNRCSISGSLVASDEKNFSRTSGHFILIHVNEN